jgi:hypothetical protein
MSYVFPPQTRKSDYDKMKATQDELLAIKIANENNIANARKMNKMGTPLPMAPQDNYSAAELLADSGVQEANARINLEKLGFRPQEASDIIAAIRVDPSLDYSMLNANFPAIEADIKRRFNVKLITSTFFIDYFKKYSENLAGATGMKVFQPDSGSKINGMVNNVAEIRRLIPDPNSILFLERAARNAGLNNALILRSLNDLANLLPTPQQLNNLSQLDPVTQQQIISDILVQLQNLPSQSDINNLVQNANSISKADLLREIEIIVNGLPPTITNLIDQYFSQVASGKQVSQGPAGTKSSYPYSTDPLKKSQVKDYLITIGISDQYGRLNGDVINTKTNTPINDFDNIVFKKKDGDSKDYPNRPYLQDTNIRELIGVPLTKTGSGVKLKIKSNEPNIKLKVGRGLSVVEQPTFKEYGKYAIHIPMLENKDLLNIKYKSLGPVPKFRQPIAVSDIFKEFLLDVLETGKPNPRVYSQIETDERKLFEEMSIGAGVWNIFNLKRTTTDNDEEESKRFELLRGEVLAGNNNPKILKELRMLVIKFMNTGKIRKNEGLNLLMQLN